MKVQQFYDHEEYNRNDIRPSDTTFASPHPHDIIMGSSKLSTNSLLQKISAFGYPVSTPRQDNDKDDFDSHSDGDDDDDDDDDDDSISDDNNVGQVGFKWRIRVLRVKDSEEEWTGVCELYFHWDKKVEGGGGGLKRRKRKTLTEKEKHAIVNIDQPEKCPIFVILNEQDSNSIEEMYYTLPGYPEVYFGYLAWTVVVHERLELEVCLSHRHTNAHTKIDR